MTANPDAIDTDVDQAEPVELEEVAEPGDEPPADWDPYAHDEEDRGAGVEVTDEEVSA